MGHGQERQFSQMKSYQDELNRRVLALKGYVDESLLDEPSNRKTIEMAIPKLAGRVLSTQELVAFMPLYSCKKTWDEVWDIYNKASGSTVGLGAVKRSARRAIDKIRLHAGKAPELRDWKPKWKQQSEKVT